MVAIPFGPQSTKPGDRQESGGRLVNAMAVPLQGQARGRYVIGSPPGLRTVATTPLATHCRGMWATGNTAFVVFDDRLQQFSGTTLTDIGTLSGSAPVTMASNNRKPVADVGCVTENGAYVLSSGGGAVPWPDADVSVPNSICFGDGYFFLTYGDGICRATGLNSTSINTLDFIQCEARADGLLRGVFFRQELFLMGQSSIEVWQNTANETGFPFSRSTVIPRGLAGQWAVAGWEPGFANALTWVGDDNIVYRLNGYSPERISNNDIERDISRQADKTALRACCYMSEGNAIWSIKGDAFCWEFNLSTGQWHERASHLSSTWIGEQTVNLNNIWYAGGVTTGDIYKIDATYYYEGDEPLVWMAQSGPGNAFPQKLAVPQAQFSFDTGVGLDTGTDPIQTDPVVEISWSDDGGNSFGMAVRRNLGREANTRIPVTVNRCGMAYGQGRVWKLEISDPVYRGLIGGDMTVEGRT